MRKAEARAAAIRQRVDEKSERNHALRRLPEFEEAIGLLRSRRAASIAYLRQADKSWDGCRVRGGVGLVFETGPDVVRRWGFGADQSPDRWSRRDRRRLEGAWRRVEPLGWRHSRDGASVWIPFDGGVRIRCGEGGEFSPRAFAERGCVTYMQGTFSDKSAGYVERRVQAGWTFHFAIDRIAEHLVSLESHQYG